jgi:ATP-dependent exoDNAse (exonuclease V) alpha subunit
MLDLQSMDDLLETTMTLVPEQQVALQKVLDFVKQTVQCRKSNLARDSPTQLGLILHGGGGVGKSATTKVCAQWAEHLLRRAGDNQHKPRVLLMCPTGMAASVIDGVTICSSLELSFGGKYMALEDKALARFRSDFEELRLIVIDEMSMVGADVMYKIHRRLGDIFSNNLPFGGLGVIFVGDMLQLRPIKSRFIFQKPKK